MTSTEQLLPAETRRTNSLGWAGSDCHTCAAGRKQCDRRRPFCRTCTSSGARCHGYAMKLDWQPGVASRGHMKKKKLQVPVHSSRPPDPKEPVMFTFIDENDPKKTRRRGRKPAPKTLSQHRSICDSAKSVETTNDDTVQRELSVGWRTLSLHPLSNETCEILYFYEQKFSFCTLTYDNVPANPWRTCLPMAFDSPCLMDGILALGKRFRARLQCETESFEVTRLKDRALQGFSATLGQASVQVLVATILVLVGLEVSWRALWSSEADNSVRRKRLLPLARPPVWCPQRHCCQGRYPGGPSRCVSALSDRHARLV